MPKRTNAARPPRQSPHKPSSSAAWRLIIADDHKLFRLSMRDVLESEPGFRIIAEAKDGQEAIHLCRLHRPDLVIMDARMPRVNGFEATRTIKEELPRTKVVLASVYYDDDPLIVSAAVRAGADDYVLKMSPIQELVDTIREVLRGAPQYP